MARNARPTILGRLNVGPKVAIIPLFFILDVAVIMAYTVATIQTQRSDADLIRICTRQRDLNQRHTKEVLLVSQGLAPEGTYRETRQILLQVIDSMIERRAGHRLDGVERHDARSSAAPTAQIRETLVEQKDLATESTSTRRTGS